MLPSTFLGLLLLLWLVTPGFLFNLLAARRRILRPASTFEEITRVVLASVLFSTLAGLLVAVGLALIPRRGFHLGRAINSGPPYLRQHYLWVAGLLAAQVVVACLLALLANWILKWQMRRSTGRSAPRLKAESAWTPLLSAAPEGTSAHVWLKLRGGVELRGKVVAFGHEIDVADRELVLGTPLEMRSGAQEKPHELLWQHLVVEGGDIESLAVKYVRDTPAPTGAAGG
jgi:hypothetical protein